MSVKAVQWQHSCNNDYPAHPEERVLYDGEKWYMPAWRHAANQEAALAVRCCPWCGETLSMPTPDEKPGTGFVALRETNSG